MKRVSYYEPHCYERLDPIYIVDGFFGRLLGEFGGYKGVKPDRNAGEPDWALIANTVCHLTEKSNVDTNKKDLYLRQLNAIQQALVMALGYSLALRKRRGIQNVHELVHELRKWEKLSWKSSPHLTKMLDANGLNGDPYLNRNSMR